MPVPKPRAYYVDIGQGDIQGGSARAQGGLVIYNNGTIKVHTTGSEICPSGAYCFYPGDKNSKPKTYCTNGSNSPVNENDPCYVSAQSSSQNGNNDVQDTGKPVFCP